MDNLLVRKRHRTLRSSLAKVTLQQISRILSPCPLHVDLFQQVHLLSHTSFPE